MNEYSELFPTARRGTRSLAAVALDLSRRSVALAVAGLMVPLGLGGMTAFGQEAPPPPPDQAQQQQTDQAPPPPADDQGPPPQDQAPPQQYQTLSADQLNQLVAPIALYPDSLVAQVLAASTYPTQVADADRFVQSNQGVAPAQLADMANSQAWDPSVKALTAFPTVLDTLNKNLDWTTQLGNAYYNQPSDVMSAVQNDRQQAYDSGKLRSTPQETVSDNPGDVVIEPANPEVVYVPYYNPWTVWGWGRPWFAWYAPPPPPGFFMGAGVGFGFGFGIGVGLWSGWGWGWGHWGCGWGPRPFIAYNHFTYVSRSVTVMNHGYYGRFDRNPEARAWNYHAAVAAHSAWNHGYYQHNGYNAGARAGYNAGARNGYNAGARAGYNRGAQTNRPAYNRPAQNYNRPAQNYNRPANRPAPNYNRPSPNYNRPAPNYNRPANRPAPEARPSGGGHPAAAPRGGGGGHPAAAPRGGGEKPHGRR